MAILKTLQETKVHPTADWVYAQLKPEYPDLSLGTVYRNLKKFCDGGVAVSLGVINGKEHFDGDITPHTHFVCNYCEAVMDMREKFFNEQDFKHISAKYNFDITGAEIIFRGVCNNCLKLKKLN